MMWRTIGVLEDGLLQGLGLFKRIYFEIFASSHFYVKCQLPCHRSGFVSF